MSAKSVTSNVSFIRRIILCLGILGLLSSPGCEIDWASVVEDVLVDTTGDFVLTDMKGTWSGTLTADSMAQNYQFIVDSTGSFTAGDGTTGSATISTSGKVIFTYYTTSGYTIELQGTMNSDKTKITMTRYSWTGSESDSISFTGTLTKSDADATTFLLTDMVGTWTGTITADSTVHNYQFTVDTAGAFVAGDGTTGSATITTTGTVSFTYVTTDGYTMVLRGTMNSDKTQITMSISSWTGDSSGSAGFTGILSKL